MKIVVSVKRVLDYNVKVQVKDDLSGVELANFKMSMNPFDEIAVEEALRLREAGLASGIVLVSVGSKQAQQTLRTGLAMGADRAILVETGDSEALSLEPLAVARILKEIVEKEEAGLVLMGKQSIDGDNSQTPQMLASLLGWSQGTFVSKVDVKGEQVEVVREIDGGLETLLLKLPSVLSVDLRLNEPRYASLPNIMKAKKKPIDLLTPADLGVDVTPRCQILQVREPEPRREGLVVDSVEELVDKLKNEARVI